MFDTGRLGCREPRRVWIRSLAVSVAVALGLAVGPAAAHAATATSVVMYSEPYDWIGGGDHRIFHPGNGTVDAAKSDPTRVVVDVTGGSLTGTEGFQLNFRAPRGYALTPGVYDNADRGQQGTQPGIDITGMGHGCNNTSGRFEVKDVAYDTAGVLTRVWLVYEQYCDGRPPLFGEVRIRVPVDDAPAVAHPALVRWPETELGVPSDTVPVTLLASAPTQVTGVSLAGESPGAFQIRADECSSKSLAAGASCNVHVRFAPTAPGTRTARLRLNTSGGVREVALEAHSWGGTTRVTMQSEAGDRVGQGRTWSYTHENAGIGIIALRQGGRFIVNGADGKNWYANFHPDDGNILVPGRYAGATRWPSWGTGPGLEVWSVEASCTKVAGEFTVTDATFRPSGAARSMALDFVQRCDGATAALRGTLEFRKGDRTPPAPWMTGRSAGSPLTPISTRPGTSVVIYSDPGDFVGEGVHRIYHPGNATIDASDSRATRAVFQVRGGTLGDWFDLTFQAPTGYTLTPGVYDSGVGDPALGGARPWPGISGDHRNCVDGTWGRFEVKELYYDSAGKLARAWIVFERHCGNREPALFGEVRIGMPAATGPALPAPALVRWPETDLGRNETTVPVTFVARQTAQVSGVGLAGEHSGDFRVRSDECTGRTLPAGETCEVWIRLMPTAVGTRTAALRVSYASGAVDEIPLQGYVWGGSTRMVMRSELGEYIGGGQTWSYGTVNDSIYPKRVPLDDTNHLFFDVNGADAITWRADFDAGAGRQLVPGHYPGAVGWPGNGTPPGLDVSGNARGCANTGEFTVTEASYYEDGRPRTLGADFVQYCEGNPAALRGSFEFRKGHSSPLAPWMTTRADGNPVPSYPGAPPQPSDPQPTEPPPPSGTPPPTESGPLAGGGTPGPEPGTVTEPAPPPAPEQATHACAGRSYAARFVMRGGPGRDRIEGGHRGDLILALAGDDAVAAAGGDDCVLGGRGNDRIHGGPGADLLLGGRGRDFVTGGRGRDVIDCGAGRDTVRAGRGDRTRNCERKLH